MPFTAAQLATGANYTLETYRRTDPIDQVTQERPFLDWLLRNKELTVFGNGFVNEPVYVAHDSNYQNYFGADQVTYNERDPVRQAKFGYYNFHDGFWFDEDKLAANGIILTDDREAVATGDEKVQLVNLLKVSYTALKEGTLDNFNLEALQDGSASAKSMPGLDHLVSTTPNTGTVGNIPAANAPYWQNNANLAIPTGSLVAEMEETWRAVTRFGGMRPDFIPCGSKFLDAYRAEAGNTINRQIVVNGRGGASLDASVTGLYFKGVELTYDPSFDDLDVLNPGATYPWSKRCYFLNSKTLKLRPFKGHWMVNRRPERLPDRYVHYFGQTSKYGMSINKRNANAVLSVA